MRFILEHVWPHIFNSKIAVFCDVIPCRLVDHMVVKDEHTASIFRVTMVETSNLV
jgi:hypothetical protein